MNEFFLNNNLTFTARSPQIKDAQWVCRKVRSFSHLSTTHIAPTITKLADNNPKVFDRFSSQTLVNRYYPKLPEEQRLVKFFSWYKNLVKRMNRARSEWNIGKKDKFAGVRNILGMFKYEKLGNCGEDASLAASILRMNGVENVYIAGITANGDWCDHVVCLFNKDGSMFDGKDLRKTIVVDPWVGGSDFASNMATKYKGLFIDLLPELKQNSKIGFNIIEKMDFSDDELCLLRRNYPNLCYPKGERNFMQKK